MRKFCTTLRVASPTTFPVWSSDGDCIAAPALTLLRQTFNGRCFDGSFIVSVEALERHGELVDFDGSDCELHVEFTARVLDLAAKDLIEVTVVDTAPLPIGSAYLGATAVCVVIRAQDNDTRALRKGQTVFVAVETVRTAILQEAPTVQGVLMSARVAAPAPAAMQGVLSSEAVAALAPLRSKLADAVRALAECKSPQLPFFCELLGGSVAEATATAGGLLELKSGDSITGVWTRPRRLGTSFARAPLAKRAYSTDLAAGLAVLMRDALLFVRAAHLMAERFADSDSFKSHSNVWEALRAPRAK